MAEREGLLRASLRSALRAAASRRSNSLPANLSNPLPGFSCSNYLLYLEGLFDPPGKEGGGEGGIRTLGTLLTYTHFPGVLLQPLGHLSGSTLRRHTKDAKGKPAGDCPQRRHIIEGISEPSFHEKMAERVAALAHPWASRHSYVLVQQDSSPCGFSSSKNNYLLLLRVFLTRRRRRWRRGWDSNPRGAYAPNRFRVCAGMTASVPLRGDMA